MTDAPSTRELLAAIRETDRKAVRHRLKKGADPNAADEESTALGHASFGGDWRLVTALLKAGAKPSLADPRGFVPLALAVSRDHERAAELLLEAGAKLDHQSGKANGTALHVAAASGATGCAKLLVEAGAKLDLRDDHQATPLHYAALHAYPNIVGRLVKAGAELDLVDEAGFTPLMHAVWLMTQPRVEEWDMEATKNERPIVLRIRHGEFFSEENGSRRKIPLSDVRKLCKAHIPEHFNYLERRSAALKLLRAGADADGRYQDGRTTLHVAAGLGEKSLLEALAKALGTTALNTTDNLGRSPAHLAAGSKRADLFTSKRLGQADWSARDQEGLTPLHYAARDGHKTIVTHLLDKYDVSLAVEPRLSTFTEQADHPELANWLLAREERLAPPARDAPTWLLKNAFVVRDATHDAKDVLELLKQGTHFLASLPRSWSNHKDATRIHAWVEDQWLEAWVTKEGSLLDDLALRPIAELVALLKRSTEKGRIPVMLVDARAYPPGTGDAVRVVLQKMAAGQDALDDGAQWLRVGASGFTLMTHPTLGALSIILEIKDNGRVEVQTLRPAAPTRAAEESKRDEAFIEAVPAAAMTRINAIGATAKDAEKQARAGKIAVVMSRLNDKLGYYAWVKDIPLVLDFVAGILKGANVVSRDQRLVDAIWEAASSGDEMPKMPNLDHQEGQLLRDGLAGRFESLVDAAKGGRLVAHGKTSDGTRWKLAGKYGQLSWSGAPVDSKVDEAEVRDALSGGTVTRMIMT